MWTEPGVWVTPWGIAFVVAMLVMWFSSRRNADAVGIDPSHLDLLVPLSLLLGASAAFAGYYFAGLQIRLFEILLGGAIAVFVYSRLAGLSFRRLLDVLALPTLAGVMVQRIGCVFAGCCWGEATSHTWQPGIVYARDSFAFLQQLQAGIINEDASHSLPVHPVQVYESLFLFVALFILLRISRAASRPGQMAAVTACTYAVIRFVLEFLRADSTDVLPGLTIVHVQCVVLLVFVIVVWMIMRPGNDDEKTPEVLAI